MPWVNVEGIRLHWRDWGAGDTTVLFVHGNLASADWFELAAARLPAGFRVVGIDWRGCGRSDKPEPTAAFANYAPARHAADMLAALSALGVDRCHLATHSTGELIALHMLLTDPGRFGRVLALAPVPARGLTFPPEALVLLERMKTSRRNTRKGLALAACSLFRPETLAEGEQPEYADHVSREQRDLFERLAEQTFGVSDGIWLGTAFHLQHAWQTGGLTSRLAEIAHPHLLLWGDRDAFIPRPDLEDMALRMPDCRLQVVPGVGHSLNIEAPDLYARRFAEFLAD
jgi:pimeloyl-ACP methyl ester carboxylesterase